MRSICYSGVVLHQLLTRSQGARYNSNLCRRNCRRDKQLESQGI